MTIKTKLITIIICGVLVIVVAYIARGEWGVGGEWGLVPVAGLVVEVMGEPERRTS